MLKALPLPFITLAVSLFATCRAYVPHPNSLSKYTTSNKTSTNQHRTIAFLFTTTTKQQELSGGTTSTAAHNRFFHRETSPPRSVLGGPHRHHAADLLRIRGGGGGSAGGQALHSSSSTTTTTQLALALNPYLASLLSGSIAGAIGVGVAFPLDTLKTKSQVLGRGGGGGGGKNAAVTFDVGGTTAGAGGSASAAAAISAGTTNADASKMNMFQLMNLIYRTEGIAGFFGGVKGMMLGQGKIVVV